MEGNDLQKLANKIMTTRKAGRDSDPHFYAGLDVLPNPDPILRAMGKADEVYDAIMSDAHVLGELRQIHAGLNTFQYRVKHGLNSDETPEELRARELCETWLQHNPADDMVWPDVIWNMGTAVLSGFKVHELVWDTRETDLGTFVLPVEVLDRPNRRFVFNQNNELRLLTKQNQIEGEETEDPYFVMTRYMPSQTQPYGRAILSACFWPYTFKKGGVKFFYQFAERFGLPFPIGKYPAGADVKSQQELLDALLELLDSGAGSIPDDSSIELITTSTSGELAQAALVNLCNREMSKALTSQTLATETQGVGSNALGKTHMERQQDNSHAIRMSVAATFNRIFRWITDYNFGVKTNAPVFEFFKDEKPSKDRAEQYEIAARLSGRVSLEAFHREMGIPMAEADEEVLKKPEANTPAKPTPEEFRASTNATSEFNSQGDDLALRAAAVKAADSAIEEDLINPIEQMLLEYEEQGKSLAEFYADVEKLGIKMDQRKLSEINAEVMTLAFAKGMEEDK